MVNRIRLRKKDNQGTEHTRGYAQGYERGYREAVVSTCSYLDSEFNDLCIRIAKLQVTLEEVLERKKVLSTKYSKLKRRQQGRY